MARAGWRTWGVGCGVAVAAMLWGTDAHAGGPDASDSVLNRPGSPAAVRLHGELGFVGVLSHRLQFGKEGTNVNLRKEMGQDNLFVFGRLSADLDVGYSRRHTITALYQPLNLESSAVTSREIRVDEVVYPAGTAVDFRYGFPFWRLSYLFDFLEDDREVGIGAGLQIRNATISYAAQDGSGLRSARDIGPVPTLKFRGRGTVYRRFWMGAEVDGFYAPIRYLNGGRTDVQGAIADASLRGGLSLAHGVDTFLNLRYIGGGAEGTSSDPEPFTDGYNRNWLHFMSLSIGVSLR